MLTYLIELRAESWQVNFDVEEEMQPMADVDIDFMLDAVCTG
jgi:hypothetical protein